jgi:multicomponent Na+:H+ antiporter subunit E
MIRNRAGATRRSAVARDGALRAARTLAFLGHYLKLLLRASMAVTMEIMTPGTSLSPAIVEFRLRSRTPLEIATIAHLVNLTPGTLVLEVRSRPVALYVHGMHAADPEAFRRELSELEDRLLYAIRQPRRESM